MLLPIDWEDLTNSERLALAAAGSDNPLAYTALWFNVTQGQSFRCNWHHHYFNWAAKKVLAGEVRTAVINTPPGSAKTEFWSIGLPAYCFTTYPRVRVLNTSFSKSLGDENSERVRELFRSAEHQMFYPFELGKDKVDDWTLNRFGKRKHQMYWRPSGGQITGVRGGHMGPGFSGYVASDDWDKIDDLFSETKRNKSNQRLVNTLRSRRAHSGTPYIHTQQRGHVNDSTGFLLAGGMGLDIDLHIVIPALINEEYIWSLPPEIAAKAWQCVAGTPQVDGYWSYWPAKDSLEDLLALRNAHPYTFQSQAMQAPESLNGGVFAEEDFLFYGDLVGRPPDEVDGQRDTGPDLPTPPRFEYRFITVDTAQKTSERNDWTVFAEWGKYAGRLYRLRYERGRYNATMLRQKFTAFVKACHAGNSLFNGVCREALVEDKSSGTGLIQETASLLPIPVLPVPRTKDKLTRAMDVQGHVAQQKVVLPYGDKDNGGFVAEVCSFAPDDSHPFDDQTDVMIDAVHHEFVAPLVGSRAGVIRRKRR